MRKICDINNKSSAYCRCMVYSVTDQDVYLFFYKMREDGPATADNWYRSIEDAESAAVECGASSEWIEIADPVPGAQHDWIQPTRIKQDRDGNKLHGQFESISK